MIIPQQVGNLKNVNYLILLLKKMKRIKQLLVMCYDPPLILDKQLMYSAQFKGANTRTQQDSQPLSEERDYGPDCDDRYPATYLAGEREGGKAPEEGKPATRRWLPPHPAYRQPGGSQADFPPMRRSPERQDYSCTSC